MKIMKRMVSGEWKVRACGVLLAVTMAAGMTACGSKSGDNGSIQGTVQESVQAQTDGVFADGSELGEGNTEFTLTVTDKEGTESSFTIYTDKENVGDALTEIGMIAGEEGDYGLYVKTVNGVTADYDVDQTYWAFYINGEYASTGVDATPVTAGDTYSFKVEK